MTDEEKRSNPHSEVTGGYVRSYGHKESWKIMWNKFLDEEKEIIKSIPNFDKDLFFEITGIEI